MSKTKLYHLEGQGEEIFFKTQKRQTFDSSLFMPIFYGQPLWRPTSKATEIKDMYLEDIIQEVTQLVRCSKDKINPELLPQMGYIRSETFDKDFPADKYYTLKIVTYTKKIGDNIQLTVTDSYTFVEAPDTWQHSALFVEINQGIYYQKVGVSTMAELNALAELLGDQPNINKKIKNNLLHTTNQS